MNLPGGTTVAAGAAVTVNLSSLDFTRDEIDADFAVRLARRCGTRQRTAINTAYTPNFDEVGVGERPVHGSGRRQRADDVRGERALHRHDQLVHAERHALTLK